MKALILSLALTACSSSTGFINSSADASSPIPVIEACVKANTYCITEGTGGLSVGLCSLAMQCELLIPELVVQQFANQNACMVVRSNALIVGQLNGTSAICEVP